MLGIIDPWIWGVYLLCILSTALCVGYGLVNWNRGADEEQLRIAGEAVLEKAEGKQ